MKINCVWEHNGDDTLLWAVDFPGASSRGENSEVAKKKLSDEISSYILWSEAEKCDKFDINIVQDHPCMLSIKDADSDVIFDSEKLSLTREGYEKLKSLALKSAKDFLTLYNSIPNKNLPLKNRRKTFYGELPTTAEEMYLHTKSVNEYYFGEIGIGADNEGDIYDCRKRGFEALEEKKNFHFLAANEGSYGEMWSLCKLMRRFIWHDRIHAKAMYRNAIKIWSSDLISNPFCF